MSQTLIAANERTLRGWEAFKVFPPHATLNLKEYPHTQGHALPGITELIVLAIWQSPEKRLSIQEIYEAIELRFPPVSLKKRNAVRESIRHNLSLKQCFVKMKRPSYDVVRRGMLWTILRRKSETCHPYSR
ncbi:fork head domain-containing protein [Panaeolus papilionaceus]|nr:fork head domain-containing protein [Panaeolus papilionaceus]